MNTDAYITALPTTCKWCDSSDLHLNIHINDYHAADIRCTSCGKWNMWVAKEAIELLLEERVRKNEY